MRFMIIRKADKNTEAGVLPSQELLAAMMKYNEELVKAGVMLQGEGSSRARRARASGPTAGSRSSSTARSPKQRSSSRALR